MMTGTAAVSRLMGWINLEYEEGVRRTHPTLVGSGWLLEAAKDAGFRFTY